MEHKDFLTPIYLKLFEKSISEKDYIELFSLYISSNPDFKYNRTYLTDSIDIFFIAVSDLKQKISAINRIVSRIKKSLRIEKDISIVFDEFFEYKIKDFPESNFKIINPEKFRFDKVTMDDCIIRFIWI